MVHFHCGLAAEAVEKKAHSITTIIAAVLRGTFQTRHFIAFLFLILLFNWHYSQILLVFRLPENIHKKEWSQQ